MAKPLRAPPALTGPADYARAAAAVHALQTAHSGWLARAESHYWTWDEARRRAPAAVGADDAWLALALLRAVQSRDLPLLRDVHGRPFRYGLPAPLLDAVLRAAEFAGDPFGLAGQQPVGQAAREAQRVGSIEEALHSSIIEGAATTRPAGRQFLLEGRRPRNKSERMIRNNFQTIEMLAESAAEPMTPRLLLDIHRSMTEGTLDDPRDAGRIQVPGDVRVRVEDPDGNVLHYPPPAEELEVRFARLCDFANGVGDYVPPLLRAMLLHFQLAHDHPFVDGNGRTARALFYWSMLRDGVSLVRYLTISKFILDSQAQYGRAYRDAESTSDVTYFLLYHLKVYRLATAALSSWVRRRVDEVREADASLEHFGDLNLRQRTLLQAALREGTAAFRAREVERRFGVTFRTAMTDLDQLAAAGILSVARRGREKVFRVPVDLRARIRHGPDHDGRQLSLLREP
jgi:Fic family protein